MGWSENNSNWFACCEKATKEENIEEPLDGFLIRQLLTTQTEIKPKR